MGANRIDLGCEPGMRWNEATESVRALIDQGISVSIDTFDPWEVEQAVKGGASLVLSVNSANCERAVDWGVEVVVVPDTPEDYRGSMVRTAEFL